MTFFPEPSFDLIKEFAGINQAKFHHKKIARMMDVYIEYFRVAYNNGETIPIVYEIKFTAECLEDSTHDRNCRDKYDNFRYTQALDLYLIQWEKVYTKPLEELSWLKLTTKPDPPRNTFRDDFPELTPDMTSESCYIITYAELIHFCRVNAIPTNSYINLNRLSIISLILRYNFDD